MPRREPTEKLLLPLQKIMAVCYALRRDTQQEPGRRSQAVAGLSLTFWPNPVYRNHPAEKRWYFSVAIREVAAQPVHVVQYRGEWYDMDGRLLEMKEEQLDLRLGPLQHLSYADLWVTSAIPHFRYRLILLGRDAHQREVSAEGVLLCQ
jgi:hypothetical protein